MLLMFNVDNITNEHVPYIIEKLMKKGAENVHVLPSITKKGRQDHIFFVDLPKGEVEAVSREIVRETGTIGIRIIKEEHISYDYEFKKIEININSKKYNLRVKLIFDKDKECLAVKAEYEDIRSIANDSNDFSFNELKTIIEGEVIKKISTKKIKVNIT
ncbi:MAG: nickel insertion protein [Halanaerobium sp.]